MERSFCRELAKRKAGRIVLVARSERDLQELGQELIDAYGVDVHIMVADLSDPAAPESIYAETERRGLTIDLLVNNAGFGSHGFFDELDPTREQAMIAVNISSLVALHPAVLARHA
ncbi:MAG: SDR family NAD(P)-dependent oxidoreductase [Armatimonas sp.]